MREFQCTITADQKEHKVSHLKKKNLDDPWDFWENILWSDKKNIQFCGRFELHYICHAKCKQGYHNENIIPTVMMMVMMVSGCFAALGAGRLAVIDGTVNFALPENPGKENVCPSLLLWNSSAFLLCSRIIIQNTPQSPPVNGSKNEKKWGFWSGIVKSDWDVFCMILNGLSYSKPLQCGWIKAILERRVQCSRDMWKTEKSGTTSY